MAAVCLSPMRVSFRIPAHVEVSYYQGLGPLFFLRQQDSSPAPRKRSRLHPVILSPPLLKRIRSWQPRVLTKTRRSTC